MKHTKIYAVLLSALIGAPLCGCNPEELFIKDDSSASDHSDQRYDVASLKTEVETLKDTWTYQDKEDEIQQQIESLLRAVDDAYTRNVKAEMAYYANWSDDDLDVLQQQTYEDYVVVTDMVTWAFANGYKNSMYSKLFAPYVDDMVLDYYLVNNLNRIMAYARTDAAESSDLLDAYYDSAYNSDMDIDDTNLECAKLYLETLKSYDTSAFLYDYYNRDYTAAQVSEVYQEVLEKLVPLQNELEEQLNSMLDQFGGSYDGSAYDLVREYAPRLSPEIGESAEKLFSDSLYVIAEGEDCYDGSYTISLPGENSAMIYTYLDGSFYDLVTVSHEFGHFHCDWRDTTPVFLQSTNLDIAESQSQCMEMLFTSFYPELFEDAANYYEMVAVYNLVDSIVSGFAVGEFEYEVMQQLDTAKPKDVAELFSSISETTNLGRELYQITHLYEQPGYYISYGVSAFPALQMYTMMQDDMDQALETYAKLGKISCLSGEYTFSSAMKECGFTDFFQPDAADDVISKLIERIAVLQQ